MPRQAQSTSAGDQTLKASLFRHKLALILVTCFSSLLVVYIVAMLLSLFNPGFEPDLTPVERFKAASHSFISDLLPNIASSLLAAIASTFIAIFVFNKLQDDLTADRIASKLKESDVFDEIANNLARRDQGGILRVINPKTDDNFLRSVAKRISAAKKGSEVVIVDNWLCADDNDVSKDFVTQVGKALAKGVAVTFILMHPNSPLVRRRELDIRNVRENIHNSMNVLTDICTAWHAESKQRNEPVNTKLLSVYCLDTYLSLQIFYIPGASYLGFYTPVGIALETPQLEIAPSSLVHSMLDSYVARLKVLCSRPQDGVSICVKLPGCDVPVAPSVTPEQLYHHILPSQLGDASRLLEKCLTATKLPQLQLGSPMDELFAKLNRNELMALKSGIDRFLIGLETHEHASDIHPAAPQSSDLFALGNQIKLIGFHATRKEGRIALSQHSYNLRISAAEIPGTDASVRGTYMEEAAVVPYTMTATGHLASGKIALIGRHDDESSLTLIYNHKEKRTMWGIHVFLDFDNKATCAPIVVSYTKPGEKELTALEACKLLKEREPKDERVTERNWLVPDDVLLASLLVPGE
ncbi:hypothetical protein [Roseimicrobium sp. ORNL1]|uniref:hypothetical protein n=1 Tax=Roseimicrobium sp. ORNL1 TaxID=2711231 RepID=UPI0013E17B06|nr:hypothetical protein [Roseimicrobium sp. ORNL1]QIF02026.1 hypothetical protein G5S37_10945 [Roseimicrobium sp. ORNL1]